MKKLLSLTVGLAVGALFAVPVPSTGFITFSTQGPDKYADDSVVKDGEAYALVWSADGAFEGLNADGSAKDANDKVLFIGNFAKGGRCGTVAFEVAGECAESGFFDLWLLDTRVFDNGQVVKVGKVGDKVTISRAVKATATVTASATVPGSAAGVEGGVVAAAPTVNPATVPAPKISGLSFDRDQNGNRVVVLEIQNSVPGVNYAAASGASPEAVGETAGGLTSGNGGTITIIRPATEGTQFFKGLVR